MSTTMPVPPMAELVTLREMLMQRQKVWSHRRTRTPLPLRRGTAGEPRAPLLASFAETHRTGFFSVGLVPTLDD